MIFRSTFQKLIKRYMDNVALREEAQMRLLARIKARIYEPLYDLRWSVQGYRSLLTGQKRQRHDP